MKVSYSRAIGLSNGPGSCGNLFLIDGWIFLWTLRSIKTFPAARRRYLLIRKTKKRNSIPLQTSFIILAQTNTFPSFKQCEFLPDSSFGTCLFPIIESQEIPKLAHMEGYSFCAIWILEVGAAASVVQVYKCNAFSVDNQFSLGARNERKHIISIQIYNCSESGSSKSLSL